MNDVFCWSSIVCTFCAWQSVFLEAPFGNCGKGLLSKYVSDNDGEYRYSKCRREGATVAMEKACDCKDAFMPGNKTVCKTNEYLHCVVLNKGENRQTRLCL